MPVRGTSRGAYSAGMPYKVEPDPDHEGAYRVRNTETGDVKGSGMTEDDAVRQFRLLEGIEHGWSPSNRADPRWGGSPEEGPPPPVEYRSLC